MNKVRYEARNENWQKDIQSLKDSVDQKTSEVDAKQNKSDERFISESDFYRMMSDDKSFQLKWIMVCAWITIMIALLFRK